MNNVSHSELSVYAGNPFFCQELSLQEVLSENENIRQFIDEDNFQEGFAQADLNEDNELTFDNFRGE